MQPGVSIEGMGMKAHRFISILYTENSVINIVQLVILSAFIFISAFILLSSFPVRNIPLKSHVYALWTSLQWSAYFAQHVFALWSVVHKKDLQCIFIDFDDKVMFLVVAEGLEAPDNIVIKPRPWQHDDRISSDELCEMRNIFWHNIPRFGGQPDIWRALRRAAEIDLPYAQAILDENNLRLGNPDMTELSLYMLSEPSNMHGKAEAGSGRRKERVPGGTLKKLMARSGMDLKMAKLLSFKLYVFRFCDLSFVKTLMNK
ncbi:ubiquitin domain-containing protein 1-like protein [Tanacetum coccineum]